MNAMDSKIRLELSIPGDVGHVRHRVNEAVNALNALGFRLEGTLDAGRVFLFADHEAAVDSSTVDPSPVGRVMGDALQWTRDAGIPGSGGTEPDWDAGHRKAAREIGNNADQPDDLPDGEAPNPVLVHDLCGMPVCLHDKSAHNIGVPKAKAGLRAAQPPGTHCTVEVAKGRLCPCPGFSPVTGQLAKPGPY